MSYVYKADGARSERLVRLRRRLIGRAMRSRLSWEQAEDVAQETISRALEEGLHEEDHLEAWATVVARNLTIDELRRSLKSNGTADQFDWLPAADDRLERVEDHHLAESLRCRVELLPEPQRQVIRALVAGASICEVAATSGTSVRSIESHLMRARRKLRRCS